MITRARGIRTMPCIQGVKCNAMIISEQKGIYRECPHSPSTLGFTPSVLLCCLVLLPMHYHFLAVLLLGIFPHIPEHHFSFIIYISLIIIHHSLYMPFFCVQG